MNKILSQEILKKLIEPQADVGFTETISLTLLVQHLGISEKICFDRLKIRMFSLSS